MANAKQVDFLLAGVIGNSNSAAFNGKPLSGGKVYFRVPGTTTAKVVWIDAGKATPAVNPLILDSEGRAEVYAEGTYDLKIDDANDVEIELIADVGYASNPIATLTVNAVSTDVTLTTANQIVVVDSSAGVRTETLPAVAGVLGQLIVIVREGANDVKVLPASGETINGATSIVISPDKGSVSLRAVAGGWVGSAVTSPSAIAGVIQNETNIFLNTVRDQSRNAIAAENMEEGYTDDYQTQNAQGADETNSTGFTYDTGNKSYRNIAGGTGLNEDFDFSVESDYLQKEFTNANQSTSQATFTNASATVTISSGTWPTNALNMRISPDAGVTWFDIKTRVSGTSLTLNSNFTGTTGAKDYIIRPTEFVSGKVQLNEVPVLTTTTVDAGLNNDNSASVQTMVNRSMSVPNGSTITQIGMYLDVADSGAKIKVVKENSSTDIDVIQTENISHGGTGLEYFTLVTPYVVPATGTYRIAVYSSLTGGVNHFFGAGGTSTTSFFTGEAVGTSETWTTSTRALEGGVKYTTPKNVINESVGVVPKFSALKFSTNWTALATGSAITEPGGGSYCFIFLPAGVTQYNHVNTLVTMWNATAGAYKKVVKWNASTSQWERNNDGTNTSAETWVTMTGADATDIVHAIAKAFSSNGALFMSSTSFAAMTDVNFKSAGGFVFGTHVKYGMAWRQFSGSNTSQRKVDLIRTTVDTDNAAMTFKTQPFTTLNAPASLHLFTIEERNVGTPTYKISRDGGTTTTTVTMALVGTESGTKKIYRSTTDVSLTPTGTSITAQIDVAQTEDLRLHAIGLFGRQ